MRAIASGVAVTRLGAGQRYWQVVLVVAAPGQKHLSRRTSAIPMSQ